MLQRIPGRADRHTTVEVFEPSQHEEMAPRVLDRFVLAQGEDRLNYEMPSATAGFRYVDPLPEELEDLERRRRENPSEPTPAQEAKFLTPQVRDEIAAGGDRQQELERTERQLQKRRDEASGRSKAESAKRAKARGFETAPSMAPQGSNVGNVHVAVDPQNQPVRVAEPVPGARPSREAGRDPHGGATAHSGGVTTPGSAPAEAKEGQRVMSTPEVPNVGSKGSTKRRSPGKAKTAEYRPTKAKRQGAEKATKRSATKKTSRK